jgi:hypothetical protein
MTKSRTSEEAMAASFSRLDPTKGVEAQRGSAARVRPWPPASQARIQRWGD